MKNYRLIYIIGVSVLVLILLFMFSGCNPVKRVTKKIDNACELCDSLRPKKIIDSVKIVKETITEIDTIYEIQTDSLVIIEKVPCQDIEEKTVSDGAVNISYNVSDGYLNLKAECKDTIEILNKTIKELNKNTSNSETIVYRNKEIKVKSPLNIFLLIGFVIETMLIIFAIYLAIKKRILRDI